MKFKIKKYIPLISVICIVVIVGLMFLNPNFANKIESVMQNSLTISEEESLNQTGTTVTYNISLDNIPEYADKPYVTINNNVPFFSENEITEYTVSGFEQYAPLDNLGRCGETIAYVGKETMPTEKRGDIGMVKPSGWNNKSYDFVDGQWVYNRCHLIGWQLTAENANERNLITGTRYMNVEGMLPFENTVADYVKETKNHVLYRVTPIFEDKNLVADGVLMEAYSYEDGGDGVHYCVFCYNVQPGVKIDYATGKNKAA